MRIARRWLVCAGVISALAAIVAVDRLTERPPQQRERFALIDALSAATAADMSTVGLVASDYEQLAAPAPRDADLSVAQVEDMVRQAVTLAGGLHQHLSPDAEWVVIKPNVVELKRQGSGVITDWRVVRALVRIVHEIAPQARISIAEGGAWVPPDKAGQVDLGMGMGTEQVVGDGFEIAGYRALLQDPELAGIDLDLVDLNFDESHAVQVPGGGYVFATYQIPQTILECDFLITVPVLKIIGAVGMTNALKNFVGIAPGTAYGWPKMRGTPGTPGLPHMPEILDEVIVDLTSLAEADFAVVDAIVGMERGKTDENGEGQPRRLNAVLASADIVAADAVSAELIGLNPADLEYLSLAAYRGLGQDNPDRIKVNGTPLEQIATRFEKYPSRQSWYGESGHYGQGCRTWLLAGPFASAQQQPGKESVDAAAPGALPGRNGWTEPVFFHDDKIDLDKYFGDPSDCYVYAYAEFYAPRDQQAELWLGSDEGLRVWIAGQQVYDHQGRRRHALPNDRVSIALREGWNPLLVRAEQTRGRFDFSLNICEVEPDYRYDGNRVRGLTFRVPALEGQAQVGAVDVAAETQEVSEQAVILKAASGRESFDSLLASLRAALAARGSQVDSVTVSGLTGHAFRLCVADSLERDYARQPDLPEGSAPYARLGFDVTLIQAPPQAVQLADLQLEAWERVKQSIDAGAPAVAHLGWAYRLIVGCDPRRETYFVEGWHGDHPDQIEMDALGADESASGLVVFVLGEPRPVDPAAARLAALRSALAEASRPDDASGKRSFGFRAYERWASILETGQAADRRGPGLTAATALEARAAAAAYLQSLVGQVPSAASTDLAAAAASYRDEVAILAQLATIYPYRRSRPMPGASGAPGGAPPQVDPAGSAQLVRSALAADRRAVDAIAAALEILEGRG